MLRLMLADDEQYERDYLEKIIKDSYPTLLEIVYKAGDGVEFLENVEKCNPHIILLDIKMPRMDGLETAKHLREKYPDTQVVIVSAYSDFNYAKQAMKLGISEYLLKPYTDAEFLAALDRVIARIREREDTLSMLSYSEKQEEQKLDLFKDMEKDVLWNLFLKKTDIKDLRDTFEGHGISDCWSKVVHISCAALASMGDFSQEVLKNYFHMENVTVLNSIWMNQMVICLFAEHKESFTELNSCIRRARNYLAEEHQISVNCGASGLYYGLEALGEAYEEAVEFATAFSDEETQKEFADETEQMKKICDLEKQLIESLSMQEEERSIDYFTEILEILEECLDYQDIAVKLNFGRSLLTVILGINRMPGYRVKTKEALSQIGKLEQLNFSGDNLRNHLDFFARMEVQRD